MRFYYLFFYFILICKKRKKKKEKEKEKAREGKDFTVRASLSHGYEPNWASLSYIGLRSSRALRLLYHIEFLKSWHLLSHFSYLRFRLCQVRIPLTNPLKKLCRSTKSFFLFYKVSERSKIWVQIAPYGDAKVWKVFWMIEERWSLGRRDFWYFLSLEILTLTSMLTINWVFFEHDIFLG